MDDTDSTTPSLLDDIENDPINPYEFELSVYHKIYYFVIEYVVSTAHLLLCVAILLASSLFFYAFHKFKRLQTRTNYILLHYFVSITLASLFFALMILFMMISVWHRFAFNFLATLGFSLLGASFIFAFLLAQDWILSVSNTRFAQKYQTYYKWMIGAVYLFIAVDVLLYTIFSEYIISFLAVICVILYGVHGIAIIVLNVIRYRKQVVSEESKQTLYALNVASVYYLMWLPPVIGGFLNFIHALVGGVRASFPMVVLLACLTYLFEIIAFSAPVVIVFLLARWDRNFKMAYDYVFKKSIRKYELSENNLDEV